MCVEFTDARFNHFNTYRAERYSQLVTATERQLIPLHPHSTEPTSTKTRYITQASSQSKVKQDLTHAICYTICFTSVILRQILASGPRTRPRTGPRGNENLKWINIQNNLVWKCQENISNTARYLITERTVHEQIQHVFLYIESSRRLYARRTNGTSVLSFLLELIKKPLYRQNVDTAKRAEKALVGLLQLPTTTAWRL